MCHSVPTTDIWPNWILTYFIKISKNFKIQHGSPQESMHMFELICPYNSTWVCHCDLCVSENVAIWPFQIFYCLLIEKLTDWCVLVCQLQTYGQIEQIEFCHILLKFQGNFKTQHGSPQRSLCICLSLSVPTTLCECVTVTCVSLKMWPFGLFKYFIAY